MSTGTLSVLPSRLMRMPQRTLPPEQNLLHSGCSEKTAMPAGALGGYTSILLHSSPLPPGRPDRRPLSWPGSGRPGPGRPGRHGVKPPAMPAWSLHLRLHHPSPVRPAMPAWSLHPRLHHPSSMRPAMLAWSKHPPQRHHPSSVRIVIVVTCCDLLWRVVTCCDRVWHVVTCCDMLRQGVTCCDMLWQVVSCCEMFWHVVTCCDMFSS